MNFSASFRTVLGALGVLLSSCAASPPPPTSPEHAEVAAQEVTRLARARTPEEKVAVLLDLLDARVERMELLVSGSREDHLAAQVASYRRLALEALRPNLARAPGTAPRVRSRLKSQEKRLAARPPTRDALNACREVLAGLPGE